MCVMKCVIKTVLENMDVIRPVFLPGVMTVDFTDTCFKRFNRRSQLRFCMK